MLLHAPVQRATAQAKRFGGLTDVSLETLQGFTDKNRFHRLETELFEICGLRTLQVQSQISRLYLFAPAHEHGALHRVIEFPNVPRPRVLVQNLQGELVEPIDLAAIARSVTLQKMHREGRKVFSPLPQRRNPNLNRIQPEQQVLAELS